MWASLFRLKRFTKRNWSFRLKLEQILHYLQAILNMNRKFFRPFSLEEIKHIRSSSVLCHLDNNFGLVLSNEHVFISAIHF